MPECHGFDTRITPPIHRSAPIAPDAAMRLLDEAWAYFTPGLPPRLPAMQYGEALGEI